jgi:hypothetical protein
VSELTGSRGFTPKAVRDGYITIVRLKGSLKTTQPLVCHPDPRLNVREQIIALAENSEPEKPVFQFTRHRFWKIIRQHAARPRASQPNDHLLVQQCWPVEQQAD